MADVETIKCPHCKKTIKLTDALVSGLKDNVRAELDKEAAEERKLAVDAAVAETEKRVVVLHGQMKEKDEKLAEAQRAQANVIRLQSKLEEDRRELELTIAKKVREESTAARVDLERSIRESSQLAIAEKDEQLSAMRRQIDELKRKAEQGSQQSQGEVQELVLESTLRSAFPTDIIAPVAKGVTGADAVQVVRRGESNSGSIIWESKRTKNWSPGWLPKLREDQRAAGADIAVLVTQTMPMDGDGRDGRVDGFVLIDGVWVVEWRWAIHLAAVLRQGLIQVAITRSSQEGSKTKAELLYGYLTSQPFKQRLQGIVERFSEMKSGLDKERGAMTKLWAAREQQINSAVEQLAGMMGDFQGIAGGGEGENGSVIGGTEALRLG